MNRVLSILVAFVLSLGAISLSASLGSAAPVRADTVRPTKVSSQLDAVKAVKTDVACLSVAYLDTKAQLQVASVSDENFTAFAEGGANVLATVSTPQCYPYLCPNGGQVDSADDCDSCIANAPQDGVRDCSTCCRRNVVPAGSDPNPCCSRECGVDACK